MSSEPAYTRSRGMLHWSSHLMPHGMLQKRHTGAKVANMCGSEVGPQVNGPKQMPGNDLQCPLATHDQQLAQSADTFENAVTSVGAREQIESAVVA
eukprot:14590267-Alexandrium_andersonii.AAC.2